VFDTSTARGADGARTAWEAKVRASHPELLDAPVQNASHIPLKPAYGPSDIDDLDFEKIGYPGQYPYTRGVYPLQYQALGWMNQMVHGFGTPEETNERMRLLLAEGMEGYGGRPAFNLVFDLPTQEGYDADDPVALGRVGRSGVSVSTVDDLDRVFANFDLDKINASLIMADPSIAILGMYVVLAERRGVAPDKLRGNTMNFLYNTFHMDRHGFPPHAALRLIAELVKYTAVHAPRWNSTNLCGYNIRQSGASAAQELAYTMATSIAITEECMAHGLAPDEFLPRFGFQLDIDNDLFEDVAKIRALRRMWATINRERFGAKDPQSLQARMHVHTSGAALTAQQPLVNIVRSTIHTLAAVFAGANSIQTSAHDEALSIPTEEAAVLALRTQQVIRHESRIPDVSDPLGGSYYVEWLTNRMVAAADVLLEELDREGGGFVSAWESGWLRERIAGEAYQRRRQVESGEQVVVGVNRYVNDEPTPVPVFLVSDDAERSQLKRLAEFRAARDSIASERGLKELAALVESGGDLMPGVLEAFRRDATLGEVMAVFRQAWGRGNVY
jgi:methylmalonyl-CoA mutase N-terminal domain/subunit